MKKISIFCLLALFSQISMAQIGIDKECTLNNMTILFFPPIDTVEIQSNDQIYRIIKTYGEITIFQNKKTFYLDRVLKSSPDKKLSKVTLYKADEIYKSHRDNFSLYINPDTLPPNSTPIVYMTSDMKGNIKDVVFIYESDLNIPGYVLSNLERDIKRESRLIFDITPSMQMDDFMIYGCTIEKDGLIPFEN